MKLTSKIVLIVLIVSLFGSVLEIWGGSWDITSHAIGAPESFFTPPHGVLYSGVGISLIAAIIALGIIGKDKEIRHKSFALGLKLIIIGSMIQIVAGPSDYLWHELFGTDGLLSPTHLTLITGILIQSVGIIVGLTRLTPHNFKAVKPSLTVGFSALWFIVIAFAFQFGLPISNGETINLNPDPYAGVIILGITIPFFCTLIFWGAVKSMKGFGWASMAVAGLIIMNITANVIPNEDLWGFISWFVVPMITAIIGDAIMNNKIRINKFKEEIAGGIVGAVFIVNSMPLVGMSFIQFYVFSEVSGYSLLTEFSETLAIWFAVLSIPSAITGIIAVKIAKKKISIPAESTI
ncbi:MAG: hypothetical protein OEW78_04305 [Nitrosopumilus sp.]|uniref:hypothetical protein n=1 Tax=Nitrosopumilus sp. TaxID=2024843 RepID=UPI002471F28C|nr:hypothetical protein [Nitrosopumilus sp.]MDH5431088.1 hypothetical protein [Nitrosopumilus sp.]MDH5666095.1 hypothetical protein [Nitrosopumilus sp.]